jgi:N-methylhydantoinase A
MLASNVIKDYVQTVMLPGTTPHEVLTDLLSHIAEQGVHDVQNQGVSEDNIVIERNVDVRYAGQSYELNIPFTINFISDFQQSHKMTYGYSYKDKPIEIVNLRVRAIGMVTPIRLPQISVSSNFENTSPDGLVNIELREGTSTIPLYNYEQLTPGMKFIGPALIVSPDTTIVVNTADKISIDNYQNISVDIGPMS